MERSESARCSGGKVYGHSGSGDRRSRREEAIRASTETQEIGGGGGGGGGGEIERESSPPNLRSGGRGKERYFCRGYRAVLFWVGGKRRTQYPPDGGSCGGNEPTTHLPGLLTERMTGFLDRVAKGGPSIRRAEDSAIKKATDIHSPLPECSWTGQANGGPSTLD